MDLLKLLEKNKNKEPIFLQIIFVIYLLFKFKLPFALTQLIDNPIGNLVVVVIGLMLFKISLITGVLGMLVGYTLILRSRTTFSSPYYNTNAEEIKMELLEDYQEEPETLEEKVVSEMASIVPSQDNSTFSPVLNELNGAAKVN